MVINWTALGVVTVVAIVTTGVFVVLLSGGIRLVSAAIVRSNQQQSSTAVRGAGYALLGLAGALVLYGIWLIVPLFH